MRRHALYAAHFAGRNDLLDELDQRLGNTIQDRIARVQTDRLTLPAADLRALYADDLARAVTEEDYESVLAAVAALALEGQDERAQLEPFIRRSIVPSVFSELTAAMLAMHTDPDTALPALRSLARRETITVPYVLGTLVHSGRLEDAAGICALVLALRFNGPKLSAAILHHIITRTNPASEAPGDAAPMSSDDPDLADRRQRALPTVPPELHRQAFAALDDLATTFGEESGTTVVQGEAEQQIEWLTGALQQKADTSSQLLDLVAAVRDARLPRGLVAGAIEHGYATELIRRSLGPLICGSADDTEHDHEVQAVHAAIGHPVVADAAALLALVGLTAISRLEGQFSGIYIPPAALRDIYRATFEIRGLVGSPGTIGWDRQAKKLTYWEYTDEEFLSQLRRAEALEQFAERLTVRALSDERGPFRIIGRDPAHASWLDPLQLALADNLVLWSDDLGLRRLAREHGVAAFGTPALIDALRDRALERTPESQERILDQVVADNRDLAHNLMVDVTLHFDDLLRLAERDDWLPRSGALALSRASWWAWNSRPLTDLLNLYQQITNHRTDTLPDWQHAAMIGAARAYKPVDAAARILAVIALLGYTGQPTIDAAAEGVRRAQTVASEVGLPDPTTHLPAAAMSLAKAGMCTDPQQTVHAILSRLSAANPPAGGSH